MRHLDASSTEVALRIEKFCTNICRALQQEWLSPEERQQAEARPIADAERRRQEAITRFDNTTLRLAEAEEEKRRRDEEWRRLEQEGKLSAKDAQPRMQSEQEPQQQVKPWLLPLIGAGAAFLPFGLVGLLIGFGGFGTPSEVAPFIVSALYGVAAGMLVRRFGIPKAVAIPIIPAVFLLLVVGAFAPRDPSGQMVVTVILLVPAVTCACLAFWLHSLWARKHQMAKGARLT